jgi:hypothetical protein
MTTTPDYCIELCDTYCVEFDHRYMYHAPKAVKLATPRTAATRTRMYSNSSVQPSHTDAVVALSMTVPY